MCLINHIHHEPAQTNICAITSNNIHLVSNNKSWKKNNIREKKIFTAEITTEISILSLRWTKKFPRIKIVKLKVRIKKEYVWKSLSERNHNTKKTQRRETEPRDEKKKKKAWKKITRKNHNIERLALSALACSRARSKDLRTKRRE